MPRPRTADQCRKQKPQLPTDTRIYHCFRRFGHAGDCSAGKVTWKNQGVAAAARAER